MSQADTYNPARLGYMHTITCNDCGEAKSSDQFTRSKPSLNFKSSHRIHHSYCKACNAHRAREWRKQRPNYRGTGRLKVVPQQDRLLMSAIRQRLTDARSRCKKYGREAPQITDLELYELFLTQGRACALTGAPLSLEKDHPLCLSLDQKDPLKGYTKGNVQWLAWAVNRAKGDLTMIDFYGMCEAVMDYRKVQRLSNGSES
jgi:hypothetical protein